jgi:hypothetical protein
MKLIFSVKKIFSGDIVLWKIVVLLDRIKFVKRCPTLLFSTDGNFDLVTEGAIDEDEV